MIKFDPISSKTTKQQQLKMSHGHHDHTSSGFTVDHIHGSANNGGFNASGSGTFHGNPDIHVGGNVSHHSHGGWEGGVQGGITTHPTDNSSFGVNGGYQSNGSWNAGVSASWNF